MTRLAIFAVPMLFVATAVQAHVTVRPRESKIGAAERYTVRIPTEGKVATISVELEIPQGVTIDSVEPADGVESEMKREGGRVVSVTWTVTIDPGQNRELVFIAKNPSDATEIAWKAHQHYADGTSADWVEPAGSRRPAPVTKLTAVTGPGR